MKVCIFGGGSVGIHYARAWSKAGALVSVFDLSKAAIERFPQIWRERYGSTVPESVRITSLDEFSVSDGEFDLVVIGTPPPSHGELARLSLDAKASKFVAIQKPVCTPESQDLERLIGIEKDASALGVTLISGYNHRYSPSFQQLLSFASSSCSRDLQLSIEVNWLESWDGILRAHPWLESPSDSYLGHSRLGGGALFEHSHGLDLALYLWGYLGGSGLEQIDARSVWSDSGNYDASTTLSAVAPDGRLSLRVTQDVTTHPIQKSVRVSSDNFSAFLEFSSTSDVLHLSNSEGDKSKKFAKNRESDFDAEVSLVKLLVGGDPKLSPESRSLLDFSLALDTAIFAASAMRRGNSEREVSEKLLRTWSGRVESRRTMR